MDITPENISMCKQAEEIQKLAPKGDTMSDKDYEADLFYLPLEVRVALGHWDNDEGGWMIGHYADRRDGAIWLPRQDQLQDMVISKSEFQMDKIQDLQRRIWQFSLPNRFINSMEQLWLAFVMKELYSKQWSGTGWIKETKAINKERIKNELTNRNGRSNPQKQS